MPSWMRCLYEPWWLPFLGLCHRKGKVREPRRGNIEIHVEDSRLDDMR